MANKLEEITARSVKGDASVHKYTVVLRIAGRVRRFTTIAGSPADAVADAYFFWTGNMIAWQGTLGQDWDLVLTDDKADPQDFTHLERVPPWAIPPD